VANWADALRRGDWHGYAAFYAPTVKRYFQRRDVPNSEVLKTVKDMIDRYGAVEVCEIRDLRVRFEDDRTAVAEFRKQWQTVGPADSPSIQAERFSGEVDERLTLTASSNGWLITQEEELKVVWVKKERILAAALPAPSAAEPSGHPLQVEHSGSGFFVSIDGYLVTNEHVVRGCLEVTTPGSGKDVRLSVVRADTDLDLAILRTAETPVESASFSSSVPKNGQFVVAVGYQLGGTISTEAVITNGVISSMSVREHPELLLFTAPIQSGSSGGPLLDDSGNVVGIVVAMADAVKFLSIFRELPQNMNFAIKASVAQEFLIASKVYPSFAPVAEKLAPEDIFARAQKYTVPVHCWQ
jgi:S1-C subfamily serine protease